MKAAPQRLLNAAFFSDGLQIRLDRQLLQQPFALHWHEFYEMTFVVSGRGSNIINGVSHRLQAGDAFLLTPADFHAIAPDEGTALDLFNLIFAQPMLSDELVTLVFAGALAAGGQARFRDPTDHERFAFRLHSMAAECTGQAAGRALAAQSELNRILIEWHRHRLYHQVPGAPGQRTAAVGHAGIQRALVFIQHHFRQPITLERAASHACVSPNYFSELFRRFTGIAFQNYLQQLRLQFARSLLQSSNLPVTEVCFIAGFNTLTHFERVFRAAYGITPRQAQRQAPGHEKAQRSLQR